MVNDAKENEDCEADETAEKDFVFRFACGDFFAYGERDGAAREEEEEREDEVVEVDADPIDMFELG